MKTRRLIALTLAFTMIIALVGVSFAVEGKMGDVDGNTNVSSADAASILRSIVKLEDFDETQKVLGDLNHNGEVDAGDASMILRWIVRLDEKVERVFEQTSGDFKFIPENNRAAVTDYIGSETNIIFPTELTGHPVTAIGAGAFTGVEATSITFYTVPPEGLVDGGVDTDITLYYLKADEEQWLVEELNAYTRLPIESTPVTFTVSGLTHTYDGSIKGITAVPSDAEADFSITYRLQGTVTDPVNAGTYTYEISCGEGYVAIGEGLTGTLVINKATYDMSGITFVDATFEQNNESELQYFSLTITGTLPTGVTVTYWLGSTPFTPQSAKGVYTVTAKFQGDADNYNAIPNMTAKMTIKDPWSSLLAV